MEPKYEPVNLAEKIENARKSAMLSALGAESAAEAGAMHGALLNYEVMDKKTEAIQAGFEQALQTLVFELKGKSGQIAALIPVEEKRLEWLNTKLADISDGLHHTPPFWKEQRQKFKDYETAFDAANQDIQQENAAFKQKTLEWLEAFKSEHQQHLSGINDVQSLIKLQLLFGSDHIETSPPKPEEEGNVIFDYRPLLNWFTGGRRKTEEPTSRKGLVQYVYEKLFQKHRLFLNEIEANHQEVMSSKKKLPGQIKTAMQTEMEELPTLFKGFLHSIMAILLFSVEVPILMNYTASGLDISYTNGKTAGYYMFAFGLPLCLGLFVKEILRLLDRKWLIKLLSGLFLVMTVAPGFLFAINNYLNQGLSMGWLDIVAVLLKTTFFASLTLILSYTGAKQFVAAVSVWQHRFFNSRFTQNRKKTPWWRNLFKWKQPPTNVVQPTEQSQNPDEIQEAILKTEALLALLKADVANIHDALSQETNSPKTKLAIAFEQLAQAAESAYRAAFELGFNAQVQQLLKNKNNFI
ncbi:MAG: hypothetical protein JNJ57_12990 [Saprospiraceae bacterium]|nr:hypothetical protein [Saprospiraceae bacterium]